MYMLSLTTLKRIIDQGSYSSAAASVADVGIQIALYLDSAVEALPVWRDSIIAVCAKDHPLAHMRGIQPAVLCRQKLIVSVGREVRKLLSEWFETEEVKPIDLMEVSSFEQVRVAVLEGLGIGLLPGHVVEDELAAGRLLQLEIRNFEVSRESYVIFRKNISEPARLLVNKMIESGSSRGSPRGTESAATAGTV